MHFSFSRGAGERGWGFANTDVFALAKCAFRGSPYSGARQVIMEQLDLTGRRVMQPPHKVNLDNPDKTIIVQLIKSCCAMSVVGQYKQLAKFNLRELSQKDEEGANSADKDKSRDAKKDQTHQPPEAADAAAPAEAAAPANPAGAEDLQTGQQAET